MIQATFKYGPVVTTARRLIKKFGSKISIVVTNSTASTQGWKPGTPAPVTIQVDGVFVNYEQKFIDGTVIQQGDQKVIISVAEPLAPNLAGHIVRGLEKWNIKSIKPLNPGGTIIIYVAQVRQ